ncbi:hypothetical protein IFM89_005959 [Coptis chinensis]|uniref:Ribonucleotide reductase large subunit C-terminal domain-containing protein n=1 Tax=Coptis chinensis TaxID=261450 RepID=A0A835IAX3_9MAGN|nr:hypothetical protein IFM89_005959 [Coptis chinensis]
MGKAKKVVSAQNLWFEILKAQIETGTPYMLFKDACNRKSNQQNLGQVLYCSSYGLALRFQVKARPIYQVISSYRCKWSSFILEICCNSSVDIEDVNLLDVVVSILSKLHTSRMADNVEKLGWDFLRDGAWLSLLLSLLHTGLSGYCPTDATLDTKTL